MSLYCELLTKEHELEECQYLFNAFSSGEEAFDACFYNCYSLDYDLAFGNTSKEKFLFDILKKYYRNDFFIRYSFMKKYLCNSKAISFEEFPILSSRIDLASINGKSVAYEIKSEYDNYLKLKKQIDDYSRCFEYVYVICPEKNKEKIAKYIPSFCGIYTYKEKGMSFAIFKEAKYSPNLDSAEMLKLLRKNELDHYFRSRDIEKIKSSHSFSTLNKFFKEILKSRFMAKWSKLKKLAKEL